MSWAYVNDPILLYWPQIQELLKHNRMTGNQWNTTRLILEGYDFLSSQEHIHDLLHNLDMARNFSICPLEQVLH